MSENDLRLDVAEVGERILGRWLISVATPEK